jgi:hypothetical protein
MANLQTLKVEVEPVITVDQDTAYTCLMLLELYCKANNFVIKASEYDPQHYDFNTIGAE